jgi:Carboxypeptidase regulatory-like domain
MTTRSNTVLAVGALLVFLAMTTSSIAQERFTSGELAGFTKSPDEHIINHLDVVPSVRNVMGIVTLSGSDAPLKGALVEIRDPSMLVRAAKSNSAGRFHLEHIPPGNYTFKVTLNGYQSLIGHLSVSPLASGPPLRFGLPPGV